MIVGAVVAIAAPVSASAATLVVDGTSGTNSGSCVSPSNACLTIGYAVGQASNGDTIQIAAGTYDEQINTGLDLDFAGAGAGTTTIDSTGLSAPALALSGTDTVSGLSLTDDQGGIGGALNVSGSGAATADHVAVTTEGATSGTDGIDAGGASLALSDSTVDTVNTDADVANNSASAPFVVNDGSGIEVTAGTLEVSNSIIEAVKGIALRLHDATTSSTVSESVLESSGAVASGVSSPDPAEWQTIEDGAGDLTLDFDTVVNNTVGQAPSVTGQPPADALWVATSSSTAITATIRDSVLRAQPTANPKQDGVDIGATVINPAGPTQPPDPSWAAPVVTAADSSYTAIDDTDVPTGVDNPALDPSITAIGTAGNVAGGPGLVAGDPIATAGALSLEPGSDLVGAGDASDLDVGEKDVAGTTRGVACSGSPSEVTNIGAYESATPTCPTPPASGDALGALTQLTGAGNCVSGDGTCGTANVSGLTGGSPEDAVVSADGKNLYAVAPDPNSGSEAGIDIVEFTRTANGLQQLAAPNNCISSGPANTTGCGTGDVAALQFIGDPEPAKIAISPDGKNVYVDNSTVISEFSRDASTGALTELTTSDCIDSLTSETDCSYQDEQQISQAAAFVVSPDNDSLYLATGDNCTSASPIYVFDTRAYNCIFGGEEDGGANSDVAVLQRDPSTGVLTPGPCYADSDPNTGPSGATTCSGVQGLYGMTSLAVASNPDNVYVTSDTGGTVDGDLASDPGQIIEFQRNASSGALTSLSGATCLTAGGGCGTGSSTDHVAGIIEPQQIVVSPDGKSAYLASAQYTGGTSYFDSGALESSTLTQFTRDPATGALTALSGATCFTGDREQCASDNGPSASVEQIPGLSGAEGVTVTPDGQSVYASARTASSSGIAEFSRNTATGQLSALSSPNTCVSNGTPPGGAAAPFDCGVTTATGVSSSTADVSGDVLASADCTAVYLLSSELAEFARPVPSGATGCAASGGSQSAASLSTTGLSFGTVAGAPVPVGTTSAAQTVTITNVSDTPLSFSGAALSGAQQGQFKISADSCTGNAVPAAHTCAISITFTPTGNAVVGAELAISDGAIDSPQHVNLTGLGGLPGATLSASALQFGDVAPGETSSPQTVTVKDTGNLPLHLSSVAISGTNSSEFKLPSNGCTGTTIAANRSCTFTVAFVPAAVGAASATVTVSDDAPGPTQHISLTATSVVGDVVGHVNDSELNGNPPVSAAGVSACTDANVCDTTTTKSDGSYSLQVPAGPVSLTVYPPTGSGLGTAYFAETVTKGQISVHDFLLKGLKGLNDGVTMDTPGGTVTSGIPVVNWDEPFTLNAPVSIPATQLPGTTRLFSYTTGVGSNDSTELGKGTYAATETLFTVHYGADGKPDAVSDPMVSPIACGAADTDGPCARMAAESGVDNGAQGSSASADLARAHSGGGPIATVADDCPAAKPVGFEIVANDYGGVNVVYNWPDGTQQIVLPLPQIAIPPMPANGNLAHDFFFATVTGGANLAINTLSELTPFTAWIPAYNAMVGIGNSAATANGSNSLALKTMEDGNAFLSMTTSFGKQMHGPFSWFVQGMSAVLGTAGNELTHSNSSVHFDAVPDCPPDNGDGYMDPSGVVRTSKGIPVPHAKVTLSAAASRKAKPKPVPNGSVVMSPANRRNPGFTTLGGNFGWDTLAGFYRVSASHSGCTVVKGKDTTVMTKLFAVPPAVSNLVLVLRCPHLRLAATHTTLRVLRAKHGTAVLLATVRRKEGHTSLRQLLGTVTFDAGKHELGAVPVNLKTGTADIAVPLLKKLSQRYKATYEGNGVFDPSTAAMR